MGQHEELNKIDRYHDIDFRDNKKKVGKYQVRLQWKAKKNKT